MNTRITIQTTPERLNQLVTEISDFDAEFEALKETSLENPGIVTDGEYFVLVAGEGYDYPRYRGPKIVKELLPRITSSIVRVICVRKQIWKETFIIRTESELRCVAKAAQEFINIDPNLL